MTVQLGPLLCSRHWRCGEGCIQKTSHKKLIDFLMEVYKKNDERIWHFINVYHDRVKCYTLTKSILFSFWATVARLPTAKFTWLMENGWKCELRFHVWQVQISFMWISTLLGSNFGGRISKVILSKDGRNLGFLKQSRLPASPAADPSDLWCGGVFVTAVRWPWHILLFCADVTPCTHAK